MTKASRIGSLVVQLRTYHPFDGAEVRSIHGTVGTKWYRLKYARETVLEGLMGLLNYARHGVAEASVDEAIYAVRDVATGLWAAAQRRASGQRLTKYQLEVLGIAIEALASDVEMVSPQTTGAVSGVPSVLGLGDDALTQLFLTATEQLDALPSTATFSEELDYWLGIIDRIKDDDADIAELEKEIPLLRRVCTLAGQMPSRARRP